jgi:hypothetical protein
MSVVTFPPHVVVRRVLCREDGEAEFAPRYVVEHVDGKGGHVLIDFFDASDGDALADAFYEAAQCGFPVIARTAGLP